VRTTRRTFLSFVPAIAISGSNAFARDHCGKITWVLDPQLGLAKAKIEGRATLLLFSADW
jgi:hypothetical protein